MKTSANEAQSQGVMPAGWPLQPVPVEAAARPSLAALALEEPSAGTFRLIHAADGQLEQILGGPGAAVRCLLAALRAPLGASLIRGTSPGGSGRCLIAFLGLPEGEPTPALAAHLGDRRYGFLLADRLNDAMQAALQRALELVRAHGGPSLPLSRADWQLALVSPRFAKRFLERSHADDGTIYSTVERRCFESGPGALARMLARAGSEEGLLTLEPVEEVARSNAFERPLRLVYPSFRALRSAYQRQGSRPVYGVCLDPASGSGVSLVYGLRRVAEALVAAIPGARLIEAPFGQLLPPLMLGPGGEILDPFHAR
ncbi:MAG: hypothetical protein U1E65_21350 [Myxococcota bacterium]